MAEGAKALQFALARVVRGRRADLDGDPRPDGRAVGAGCSAPWSAGYGALNPTCWRRPPGSARRHWPGEAVGARRAAERSRCAGSRPSVPGTAAGALRDAGLPEPTTERARRPRLVVPVPVPGPGVSGRRSPMRALASTDWRPSRTSGSTGVTWLHSESMFAPRRVPVGECPDGERALHPVRRARPAARRAPSAAAMEVPVGDRAEPPLVPHHPARASVRVDGDARPGRTVAAGPPRAVPARPTCSSGGSSPPCDEGGGGTVSLYPRASPVELEAGEVTVSAGDADGRTVPLRRGRGPVGSPRDGVALERVERWWPHTHGAQPLYPVAARVGGDEIDLGAVGFRTIEVDPSGRRVRARRSTACRSSAGVPAGTRRTRSLCQRRRGDRRHLGARAPWRDEHAPDPRRDRLRGRPLLRRPATASVSWSGRTPCSGSSTRPTTRPSSTRWSTR